MYAVAEVTNEQYKESTGSRLVEVWESGLAKPPSVAIRSLHNVVNRYLRVTRPEEAEGISNGNVDIIVYLARHDNEEIFPQDIEQRFGVTRSTSCRVLGLMHVLDVMQTNLVKTGLIGDESRYPSLEIREQCASKSRVPQESQVSQKTCDDHVPNNRDACDEYVSHVLRISQGMAIARNRR